MQVPILPTGDARGYISPGDWGGFDYRNLATGHFIESKARQAVVALFGQYVSPKLVQRMAREPAASSLTHFMRPASF